MQPALDLNKTHFTRDLGEITLFGTWVTVDEDEQPEPCLCLVRASQIASNSATPCCVVLSNAYLYYEPNTGHSYLLETAKSFVPRLGLMDTAQNIYKVADVIMDHLQELIEMPPKPIERDESRGAEVKLTDSEGRELTRELYDES